MIISAKVRTLRKGDEFIIDGNTVWTATENAERLAHGIVLSVLFADGGTGERIWDDPDMILRVRRDLT